PLVRRKLAQRSHQFFLLQLGLFLQTLESLVGFLFGTKLLEFDTVVVPVEFLAQVSDSADEVALRRFTQRKTLSALKYHFDHAARFRSLHAGERFFGGGLCSVSRNVQIHQRFVDLHSILDKRDLQFFALQSAAQGFQRFPCFQVGLVRRRAVVASLRDLSFEQARLIGKHWSLKASQPRERFVCLLLCFRRVSHLQSDTREQQMREYGFPGECRLIEESSGCNTETPGFKIPSLVEEQQGLVQIDEPGPNEIFFPPKHVSRFCKALQSLDRLPLLAISRGRVRECLGVLIAHPELFELEESFMCYFPCFFAKVQLEIDVGKIQMAEREVIGIASDFAGAPRC